MCFFYFSSGNDIEFYEQQTFLKLSPFSKQIAYIFGLAF